MDKLQKNPASEVRTDYFESEFSRLFDKFHFSLGLVKSIVFEFVKSQYCCQFDKSKFNQFVKSVSLNLFGSRLGLLCLVAGQVQGAAM